MRGTLLPGQHARLPFGMAAYEGKPFQPEDQDGAIAFNHLGK